MESHDSGMALAHLPMLAIPAVAAAVALWHDTRRRVGVSSDGRGSVPLLVLAVTTALAAVVHVWVCPEHFDESALYGSFFVVVAVAQAVYVAWVLLRPRRWLLVAGVVANVAILALWLATRLIAVPLGPGAGEREPFGTLDISAGVAELVAVVAAAWLLRRSPAPTSPSVAP